MHPLIVLGLIYLGVFNIIMFLFGNFIRRDIKQSIRMDNFRITDK